MSNEKYASGTKVDFQNQVYVVVKDEGDSLVAKRLGSSSPVSIPKSQSKLLLEEGRTPFNVNHKLNG